MALLVDELLGQHQVVVKNLESNYRKVPNISGATILGDGTVALILDTSSLVSVNLDKHRKCKGSGMATLIKNTGNGAKILVRVSTLLFDLEKKSMALIS